MKCKHFRYRHKKQVLYFYCTKYKKKINIEECHYCEYKEFKSYTPKKNKKSKRAIACDITKIHREIVYARDKQCIFCKIGFDMPDDVEKHSLALSIREIMHFIPRSLGGLGIPENLALGCHYHHQRYDDLRLPKNMREEYSKKFKRYLKSQYRDWDKKEKIYRKN